MLGGPVQIAYAVDDVDASAGAWAQLGVGPFFVRRHIEVRRVRVDGRPGTFDHSSAYGQWGSVMVELIQQHPGDAEPIVGRSGIHHVAHIVERFDVAADALRAAGRSEVLYAETHTGMPFAFHDARADRGHLIEIYEGTSGLLGFYAMVREASIGWTGADPVREL